ncbi:glucoside xylosyltransferase 1-like [Pectinophora gossypiella]|uniref:glucoside xylosyltransferase 1-like n=1 Tax=Pectinophora gossypiella TaxID=13191 RepID=UPI00214E0081|nr:glucoside xylosyltransferase 1-like [Pectinophora gossypiella]XP_049877472.1 glucoside xylosyltransferase 1-like [Pectinophora gossypiella]
MRRIPLCKLVSFICITLAVIVYFSIINNPRINQTDYVERKPAISGLRKTTPSAITRTVDRIVLSFVVCDSRFNESLNVVKSMLIFTKTPVHLVIFTEDDLMSKFKDVLTQWRRLTSNQLDFELHKINFPEAHKEDWMNLFRKCAAQRLFIPELMTHIDSLIYVDTDTLFLGPADELWSYFFKFNSSQISALALEDNNPNLSWYPRFAKHPFYGKLGLNSGVMLMNLTRMRGFGWTEYITPIMLKWKLNIPWGDQDIINIIFHHHERAVLELSCRYNYRSDQCMYGDACADATHDGIFLLHGNRKTFHNDKQPAFEAIYRAVEEYEIGTDPAEAFLSNLDKYFTEAPQSNCGNLKDAFLKVPVDTLSHMYETTVR